MHTVFVLGMDPFNEAELESLRPSGPRRFVKLLDFGEVAHSTDESIDFDTLHDKASKVLADHNGTIDGIVSYWDFPASTLAGVLRNEHGLPGPSNEAVARCEHKYWSRLEQRRAVPDVVPDFRPVDPFDQHLAGSVGLDFPFWVKPIKAHSSHLGFKVDHHLDLHESMAEMREKIGLYGRPFDQYLRRVELPDDVRAVQGHWCIAEGIISDGFQCTLEGYVHQGQVSVYGVVDSVRSGRQGSSFSRYQYPSRLPQQAQRRMVQATERVMTHFGYDDAPFNIEFFWNRRTDRIWLLEVNARISKSHGPLFRMVDGTSNHQVMVDLALGQRPDFPRRHGPFRTAAKFMVRVHHDGIVRAMPSQAEMAQVQEMFPEARIQLLAPVGTPLVWLPYQDSYSFELAEIFLGANSTRELLEKYARCLDILTFDVAVEDKAA